MKYPIHTLSQPVVDTEAKKIADAIKTGGYVANKAAIETAKRIAERRKLKENTDVSKR